MIKLLNDINKFLDVIRQEYELYAPVKEENLILFKKIDKTSDVCFNGNKTDKSLKGLFFPQTQELFRYKLSKEQPELKESLLKEGKRVVFGTRACDAKSLNILDKIFFWDYKDKFYSASRNLTVIISIACSKIQGGCFCLSLDTHPFDKNSSDIFLTLIGDSYWAEIVSDKGEELVLKYSHLFKDAENPKELTEYQKETTNKLKIKMKNRADLDILKDKLYENFEHTIWEEIAIKCIGCGVCSYLCPTCHCFDITDELIKEEGRRFRCWDCCSFGNFTKMPAHQPREHQFQRLRQRIMHKFAYFVDRFNEIACVGCGRCIEHCPVNMDITEVIDRIKKIE